MSRFNNIEDVWSFLNEIPMFQKTGASAANFSLDNIKAFCEALENPQFEYPVIHVAGTNGKGTTCYLLEKIYLKAGYKTGLFTSPHLLRYNERVRVGGVEISDDELLTFFQYSEHLFKKIPLTYFEISTALAFWFFEKQEVDLAIIETGLGGRLDATNIVHPEVSVITSIGLDHQSVLGTLIREIAGEKAGIIKQKKPTVLGFVDEGAFEVISKIAHQQKSKILPAKDLNPEWSSGVIKFQDFSVQTKFKESINKWNVACSWLVCELLQSEFPVSKKDFEAAVQAFEGAPGRFEKIHPKYNWFFSGSHNAQALDASLEAVKEIQELKDTVLVFSAMKDKISSKMLRKFKPFKKRYFVEQEGDRAAKLKDVAAYIDVVSLNTKNAQIILKELKTELVIFTGSFYFYPIVKRWTSNV